jgi:hypothetical protein
MYLCKNQTGNKYCDYTVTDKPIQCNFEARSGGSYLDCKYCKQIEELKHCPFCGERAELATKNGEHIVTCSNDNCNVYIETVGQESAEIAIKIWNTRK